MSGGCYYYAHEKISRLAERIEQGANGDPRRLAFAKHLVLVARAAKAIEWEDSGDGDSEYGEALDAVLNPQCVMSEAIVRATKVFFEVLNDVRKKI